MSISREQAQQAKAEAQANSVPEALAYTLLRDIRPNLTPCDIVTGLIPRQAFGEVHADSSGGKQLSWSTFPCTSRQGSSTGTTAQNGSR
jgi:hypothetical protein